MNIWQLSTRYYGYSDGDYVETTAASSYMNSYGDYEEQGDIEVSTYAHKQPFTYQGSHSSTPQVNGNYTGQSSYRQTDSQPQQNYMDSELASQTSQEFSMRNGGGEQPWGGNNSVQAGNMGDRSDVRNSQDQLNRSRDRLSRDMDYMRRSQDSLQVNGRVALPQDNGNYVEQGAQPLQSQNYANSDRYVF